MMGFRMQMLLVLGLYFSSVAQAQNALGGGQVISLVPKGSCNGPDDRPKRCGDGLPACNCPGFRCAGCPGCPGTPFRGSCLPNNIVFGCAQPQCDPAPVCKKGQSCESDEDCKGCGTQCKFCPVCPGQKRRGTCTSDQIACPKIGCASCEKKACTSDSDCTACGDRTLTCLKCPTCTGARPGQGTCEKQRVALCPVLDCKCDKRGNQCSDNSDCCSGSEICFKCPPCRNFNPKFGECVSRSFKRPPSLAASFGGGLGNFPACPPCLPDFGFDVGAPLP